MERENVKIGEVYQRNGEKYEVENIHSLFPELTGEIDTKEQMVLFKGVSQKDRPFYVPKTYCANLDYFCYYFIPEKIAAGNSILGISMGKVIGEWVVDKYDEENGCWRCKKINDSEGKADVYLFGEIASDGAVPCVKSPYDYPIYFYYNNVPLVERKMNMEIRERILSVLDEVRGQILSSPIGKRTVTWRRMQEVVESMKNGLEI